ncbi:MAG TPA: hypothetical protein PKE29_13475 [Phycisphaerales bacterium]|nr:hypothetical protein [Phycisphaerales bacterium]
MGAGAAGSAGATGGGAWLAAAATAWAGLALSTDGSDSSARA